MNETPNRERRRARAQRARDALETQVVTAPGGATTLENRARACISIFCRTRYRRARPEEQLDSMNGCFTGMRKTPGLVCSTLPKQRGHPTPLSLFEKSTGVSREGTRLDAFPNVVHPRGKLSGKSAVVEITPTDGCRLSSVATVTSASRRQGLDLSGQRNREWRKAGVPFQPEKRRVRLQNPGELQLAESPRAS